MREQSPGNSNSTLFCRTIVSSTGGTFVLQRVLLFPKHAFLTKHDHNMSCVACLSIWLACWLAGWLRGWAAGSPSQLEARPVFCTEEAKVGKAGEAQTDATRRLGFADPSQLPRLAHINLASARGSHIYQDAVVGRTSVCGTRSCRGCSRQES